MQSPQPRVIDLRQLEHERLIGCFLLDDVLIDCGPASRAQTLIDALGERPPRALALTHIHLDHAGSSRHAGRALARARGLGARARRASPCRPRAGCLRARSGSTATTWSGCGAETLPVPQANIRVLSGGERLDSLEVAYTPGHASHHVCYWHASSATAFVGDVAGVRVAPSSYVLRRRRRPTSTSSSGANRSSACARGGRSAWRSPTSAASRMPLASSMRSRPRSSAAGASRASSRPSSSSPRSPPDRRRQRRARPLRLLAGRAARAVLRRSGALLGQRGTPGRAASPPSNRAPPARATRWAGNGT